MSEIVTIATSARRARLAGLDRNSHNLTDPDAIASWQAVYDFAVPSLADKMLADALPFVQRTGAQGKRVEQEQVKSC